MQRRSTAFAIAAAAYTALAIAVTFPLVLRVRSVVPADLGDPLLSTSILWWNAHVLPFTERWWNGFAFFPAPGTLAFSDHRLGLSLIASPLQWLGASPLTAYNVTFLATFPLCAIGGHILGFTLTRRHDAASICGMAFGFNPFRVAHRSHLELLAAFGMPLALAAMHLYIGDRRIKWAIAVALSLILLGVSSSYYFLFFSVFVALWFLWFVRDWRTALGMAAASTASAAILLPIALEYRRFHVFYGFTRSIEEITSLSAGLTSFLAAAPQVKIWGFTAPLVGGPFPGERQIFPGLTVIVLALVGCVTLIRTARTAAFHHALRRAWRERSALPFYLAASAFLFLCSMGPTPTFFGRRSVFLAPYEWLMMLPFFSSSVRVPARFAMPALLALAAAAALAFNRLRLSPLSRRVVVSVALAGILADSWARIATPRPPDSWHAPPKLDFGAVIELPLGEFGDFAAMYRATQHGHPLINGHSGFVPAHYMALQTSLDEGTLRGLDAFAGPKPMLVVVDQQADTDGRWNQLISRDGHMTAVGEDGRWKFYSMESATTQSCPAHDIVIASASDAHGTIDLNTITDGIQATMWTTGGPQRRDDTIQVHLAERARLCELRFSIGSTWNAFPRDLEVTTSDDGAMWTRQFNGSPAGLVVRGALTNPRDIWLDVPLADTSARFVRLRLNASHPTSPWNVTELHVIGS